MNADALGGIEGPLTHAVDIAQAECVRLRHAAVDIGHLFLGLLQGFPDQASRLFGPAGMKREDLVEAVRAALPPGAPGPFSEPRATPALLETLKASRAIARGEALSFEHAIIAICRREDTLPARILRSFGVDPKEIETAALLTLALAPGAVIEEEEEADGAAPASGEARRAAPLAEDSIIAQLARDLVERARRGGMDPVIGRETEVNALLETLARRTKNNPVLVGEPGVGKSATVAGLAQRLAAGQVPGRLANLRLFELNAADLVAGTQYRGDFEGRILKLVEETAANPDIVLFIDEIHTILASGGQQGTGDAASLLKPHLARGEIRCIGATTTDEFRKFIERD
ncbi:MAG: ATP-dependent Clp protease ATP-binding subunit, partial [Planctomycetes bacterium]|nr:ATP-dependent Clp protease ATP-binding subunit [Planctomycetota bacterium]